ncbi:DUF1707 domain-containing protein [Micromonospora sp. WMMD980]|uniref:DUF1707 SHOCT-like domain-containing protein n=1 Tax=Micromonospora sp. WMMD980 TaxID=3016088 RepID=UPI0024162AEA|nr:DUF1707 domain-containing protein [Micromonospora sp. WMMD980]MDG4804664.1 DUF1707 domain-containing protein [Micromonospora sp. WMMD980]
MRAADSDREAIAERLRVALEEGRLGLHEYDERLGRAYGAKTYGELDDLLSDLPGERALPAPRAAGESVAAPVIGPAPVAAGGERAAWLMETGGPWLKVALILTAIWFVSGLGGGFGYYWPLWVLGPWGAVVLFQIWQGLATGEPAKAAERRRRKEV